MLPPTDQKVGSMTPKSKPKFVQSPKPISNHLGAPPINTEMDSMHLTYNKMEEVGKRYREVRRKLKVLSFFDTSLYSLALSVYIYI